MRYMKKGIFKLKHSTKEFKWKGNCKKMMEKGTIEWFVETEENSK